MSSPRIATLVLATSLLLVVSSPAYAAAGDVGYKDGSTSGTSSATGTKRPESALWINDGLWWANMWDPVSDDFHIFKLNPSSPATWTDTKVPIDTRAGINADTLWDGTHLYVSSHRQASTATSGDPAYLYRFGYNAVSDSYSLDTGYPTQINNLKTKTLVIAKDSTGTVWATWGQGSKIWINHTVGGDRTWGTPMLLPVSGNSVSAEDISAVVAFGGDKIGVMWGNQNSSSDGYYFAVHQDGQPDTSWTTETAWKGSGVADDHINLKADASGRVYAAIKTSFTSSSQPLTALLVRNASGTWSHYQVDTVADCPNRPTVVIDSVNGVAHVFETGPAAPAFDCSNEGGDVYEKTAPLTTFAFGSGRGTVVMRDNANHRMHNNTSTKQTVGPGTGLVAIAVERTSNFYWHSWNPLGPVAPPSAPVAAFSGSPTSGEAPLTVAFADQSTGTPSTWSWSFGDGGTSTAQNPSRVYTAAGTYDVTLTVTNSAGSDSETKSGYVRVTTPGGSGTLTFAPTDDATIDASNPAVNAGTSSRITADASPINDFLIRFTVSGTGSGTSCATIAAAKLRLTVGSTSNDQSPKGGDFRAAVDSNWSESTVVWNTAPAAVAGPPLASLGAVALNTPYLVDVTPAITGNGTFTIRASSTSTDGVRYFSRNGNAANIAPALQISCG